MHNHWLRSTFCACFLMIAVWGNSPGRQKAPARPAAAPAAGMELTKLADGVFAQVVSPDSDAVSNSGVIVLESGVLVFDTHFTPEAGAALNEKIKSVSALPVRYIVNSHFHPDHTHGNQSFSGARVIIGSRDTRRDMLERDLPKLNQAQAIAQSQVEEISKQLAQGLDARRQEALRLQLNQRQAYMRRMSLQKILAPGLTFEDSLSIVDDDREVQLMFFGPGHTDGDIILYLPQEKIAFAGDLFFHDGIPNVEDANLSEWMHTLRELLKLDATAFVPGHGYVGTRADVEKFLAYFEDLKALVEPAVTRGDPVEQVVQDTRVPAKYASYAFQSFFPANLQKMYAEIRAAQMAAAQEKTKK